MKIKLLFTVSCVAFAAAVSFAADEGDAGSRQLQIYPKNLARQHLGANLLGFDAKKQSYLPNEAAAAWLDDDIATGWPANKGKSYYLLALPEPELMTNFALSAHRLAGTVSLYASDEPAPPAAKSWTQVAKDIPIDSINDKKMEKPFSRFAKYLLIETDLAEAGPVYSLFVFGERPAVSYHLEKRAQSVNTQSLFGPYTNPQTSINLSSLYAKARVTQANTKDGFLPWQKIMDDNPETSVNIASSKAQPGLVIQYGAPQSVGRISVLADSAAKGKLEFFVINSAAGESAKSQTAATGDQAQYLKISNSEKTEGAPITPESVSLDGLTPVATVHFNGTDSRGSADFSAVTGSDLVARWTPDIANQTLTVREIDSFGVVSMNDYELTPQAVGELDRDGSKDGKDYKGDPGFKEPIGEFLPNKTPFTPGPPPFPPNLPLSR